MSKHKFTVVHRVDNNNVGDIASNPLQYFLPPDEYQVVDISQIKETKFDSSLPIVVGGGGLVGNDLFGDAIAPLMSDLSQLIRMQKQQWFLQDISNKELHAEFQPAFNNFINNFISKVKTTSAPRYIWGVGHNGPIESFSCVDLPFPDYFANFTRVGVRDWNQAQTWAPCASCMHPALSKKYGIKNDVIFFEHKKQLIKKFGNDSIPRFINSGSNVEQTIELLGSANIILTNSYHGAYWGALLGKKVIVVDPWSTKFLSMKHPPGMIRKVQDWKDTIDSVKIYDNALDECRDATVKFWESIQ